MEARARLALCNNVIVYYAYLNYVSERKQIKRHGIPPAPSIELTTAKNFQGTGGIPLLTCGIFFTRYQHSGMGVQIFYLSNTVSVAKIVTPSATFSCAHLGRAPHN